METKALVTLSPQQREMVDVIKSTVYGGGDLTDAEMAIYLAECERVGVHPLSKGAHIWKDKQGRVGLAVSVHSLTALAEKDHRAAMVDYEWVFHAEKPQQIEECICVGEVWDEMTKTWKVRKATVYREDVSWLFGKDNWRNQPRTMWENRARAKWCRTHRADVCGPLYTLDEAEDFRDTTRADPARSQAIAVVATEVLDATLLPERTQVQAEPVKATTTTAKPDDVQAIKKARWATLSKDLNAPTADLKGDVKVACMNLGIAQSAETWTDADLLAIEDAVRKMRAPAAREPGDDEDPHAKPGGGEYQRD